MLRIEWNREKYARKKINTNEKKRYKTLFWRENSFFEKFGHLSFCWELKLVTTFHLSIKYKIENQDLPVEYLSVMQSEETKLIKILSEVKRFGVITGRSKF